MRSRCDLCYLIHNDKILIQNSFKQNRAGGQYPLIFRAGEGKQKSFWQFTLWLILSLHEIKSAEREGTPLVLKQKAVLSIIQLLLLQQGLAVYQMTRRLKFVKYCAENTASENKDEPIDPFFGQVLCLDFIHLCFSSPFV